MKEGYVIWDGSAERPDIRYRDGTYYGGLHCGDTLEALISGAWQPLRLEYSHEAEIWYLTGPAGCFNAFIWMSVRK